MKKIMGRLALALALAALVATGAFFAVQRAEVLRQETAWAAVQEAAVLKQGSTGSEVRTVQT